MADVTLNGTEWTTAGNWSGGAAPSDGDNVTISTTLSGEVTMSATQSAIDLASWTVHRECTASIGSAAAPLEIGAGIMHYFGSGGLYWYMSDNGVAGQDCEECLIEANGDNVPVHLGTLSTSTDGDFEEVIIRRGTVTLLGGSNRMLFDNTTGLLRISGGRVMLASGVDTVPKMVVSGGTIPASYATITALELSNATMRQKSGTITLANIHAGGQLQLEVTATTIHVHTGGFLDLSVGSAFKTITKLIADPGSRVVGAAANNVTITTFIDNRDQVP